jgi:hypothetical protein
MFNKLKEAPPKKDYFFSLFRNEEMNNRTKKCCIYCGSIEDLTVDHVPPKALFPEPRPSNMLTVPSCGKCNGSFSKDDEYFRTILINCASVYSNPNVQKVNKKLLRSMRRPEASIMANSIRRSLQMVDVKSPGGIFLSRSPAIKIDAKRIKRIIDRITRGLFYIIHNYSVPVEYEVKSEFQDGYLSRPIWLNEEYTKYCKKLVTIGDNIFSYTYAPCVDDPNAMLIIYLFYEKLWFVSLIAPKTNIENKQTAGMV